jgi:predicted CoA-binding protein
MECEFPKENAGAGEIADILRKAKTIAVIGASLKPERPSRWISVYLKEQGYKVIPVNPGHSEVLGDKCYKRLAEIPEAVDIVDIFRDPSAVPGIVEEAIAKKVKVIWMQEGIVHNAAAQKARASGLKVVQNKCIYKEHRNFLTAEHPNDGTI